MQDLFCLGIVLIVGIVIGIYITTQLNISINERIKEVKRKKADVK